MTVRATPRPAEGPLTWLNTPNFWGEMLATALCISPACALPRRHLTDCPGEHCRGCLPATARDGLRLCGHCTRRIGEDARTIAQLHRDLEQVLIHARPGGRGGSSTGAPVPDDTVMALRHAIAGTLDRLVARITRERGIGGPTEPYLKRLPDGLEGPAQRRYRPTDRPKAQGEFIARHAEWLAAQPDADEISHDLRTLAADRRMYALAYQGPSPSRQYLGDCPLAVVDVAGNESTCGERLYHYPEQPFIACDGCGTEETVEQWQTWLVPEAATEVDAYAAAADLSLRWLRPVDPALIRQWASRGLIRPVMEPNPDHPAGGCPTCPRTEHDPDCPNWYRPRRVNRRTQYPLEEVRAYARRLWADEPAPARAGRPRLAVVA